MGYWVGLGALRGPMWWRGGHAAHCLVAPPVRAALCGHPVRYPAPPPGSCEWPDGCHGRCVGDHVETMHGMLTAC
jgi:hypothetical protein